VDSQRSSLSFGIGRAGFVSADVNLRDWNVERIEGADLAFFSFLYPPNRVSLSIYFAPSSCADILYACVIVAVDDRGA